MTSPDAEHPGRRNRGRRRCTRRSILSFGGSAGAASLAGCTGIGELVSAPAEFAVVETSVNATELELGEAAEVTVVVENVGERRGVEPIELRVDGSVAETADVVLDPGESREITFEWAADDIGEYELAVEDAPVGIARFSPDPTDDAFFVALIVEDLAAYDLDIDSEVVDERAQGGDKTVMLDYRTSAVAEDTAETEIKHFTGAFSGAVRLGWDIDSMSVTVRDLDGDPEIGYFVDVEWVQDFLDDNITGQSLMFRVMLTLEEL